MDYSSMGLARWEELISGIEGFIARIGRGALSALARLTHMQVRHPRLPPLIAQEAGQLPDSYGRTRLVVLPIDSYSVHAYWEVTGEKLAATEQSLRAGHGAQPVLRFCDLSDRSKFFDIHISLESRNWYVPLWTAGGSYLVELGLKGFDAEFMPLATSGRVQTPRAWPKLEVDDEFLRSPRPSRQAPARVFGAVPFRRADSSELLQQKLLELSELRGWSSGPVKTEAPPKQPGRRPNEPIKDLAEMAEARLTPGVSSSGTPPNI
jgi:hypothetical protein